MHILKTAQFSFCRRMKNRVPGGVKAVNLLGYNLLNRLTFRDRIRAVLPYVSRLVPGPTRSSHLRPEQTHHDLKPANIFIKYGHLKFDVKLGGFTVPRLPQLHEEQTSPSLRDAKSVPGTVHFRNHTGATSTSPTPVKL